jgi:hypothetical protein
MGMPANHRRCKGADERLAGRSDAYLADPSETFPADQALDEIQRELK